MQEIEWSPNLVSDEPTQNALYALKAAAIAATNFDRTFTHKHPEREVTVALLYSQELIMDESAIRHMGSYYREIPITSIHLRHDLVQGSFGSHAQMARQRLADRVTSSPYHYGCKFLQPGLVDQMDHGATAASEMIMEVKLLMNLEPHPHISQLYACNAKGIDSFLEKGFHSFFFVTDRLQETLTDRLDRIWRMQSADVSMNERLEIALDITSGLRFLHDRDIVYYLRPEKIGFDLRHNGRVKLCHFGQARQKGMQNVASSITKSDDVIHTLAYTAPEVLCNASITCSSDVYAFAILLWELITLKRPFDGYDRFHHYSRVVLAHERPDLKFISSNNLEELLESAWHPHLRPTMKTLNELMETMLLSGNPDDAAINLSELLGRKQQLSTSKQDATFPAPQTPIRNNSKALPPTDNGAKGTRSVRPSKASPSQQSPATRTVSYVRSTSLNKLTTINGGPASPTGRPKSVETTPTVRSNGSNSDQQYVSPVGQSATLRKHAALQSSPASSNSGKSLRLARNSNSSASCRSEKTAASSPGGTFSDDVPWQALKIPKALTRRKSTSNIVVQGEAWLPEQSPRLCTRQYAPEPSPSPRRRHHRSASMDFAPRSTNEDEFSPMAYSPTVSPRRATTRDKSKRRASISSPPTAEFKLDMVPEPTPLQRKKPTTGAIPRLMSPCKPRTSGLPTIKIDSPSSQELIGGDNTQTDPDLGKSPMEGSRMRSQSSGPGPTRKKITPSSAGTRRRPSMRKSASGRDILSAAPLKNSPIPENTATLANLNLHTEKSMTLSTGGLRRRPNMRKSSSGRAILNSPPFGNSPQSDDDAASTKGSQQSQQRGIRKLNSRRKLIKEGGSMDSSDNEQVHARQGDANSGFAWNAASDGDVRDSFTAKLRAEMRKKDPAGGGNGKVIRVKVKNKKPAV
ncbi:hypothetical protein MPSEU_000732900 [Mayamaea pseudoterrestris]|nr:hypothetical protein MPSEU_000732900 [Mayamaea pseudoterrestris]